MDSPTESQKPKRKGLKVLGWAALIVIGGSILLSSLQKAREDAAANQQVSNTQQDVTPPQTQTPQVSSSQPSASNASTGSDGTGLVRKTVSGVVRTSVINFNKVMGINQQTIIFGGNADAINDGTGWYCIVNGDQNFANTVAGDTITVTGEKAGGTQALINCRVDSVQ